MAAAFCLFFTSRKRPTSWSRRAVQTAHVVIATDNTNGPRRGRDGQYKRPTSWSRRTIQTAHVVVATDRPNESSAEAENPPQRNSLLTRTRGPCRLLLTSRLREPMPRQLVGPRRGAIFFF